MHFFIPTATILSVTGKHAERYLQARLSNDVRLCSTSRAITAAALSPQGKTEAFGRVFKDETGAFFLVLDGATVDALLAAVARFKVAEQVEIRPTGLGMLHVLDRAGVAILEDITRLVAPLETEGTISVQSGAEGVTALMRRKRTPTAGVDLIAPPPTINAAIAALRRAGGTEVAPEEQRALRLEGQLPSFPEDLNDSVILAEAGVLDAVSFTKGCYTGQEVIAKIDSLGKPPRLLTRLYAAGEHSIPPATAVLSNGKTLGKTTSSAFHRQRGATLVFALLKNDDTIGGSELSINGVPFLVG